MDTKSKTHRVVAEPSTVLRGRWHFRLIGPGIKNGRSLRTFGSKRTALKAGERNWDHILE